MYIKEVRLKGFRNFRDATIALSRKSLVIGCNEVGKSNLLYALRLLLDRSLPELALEPQDSDFFAYAETAEIEILVRLVEVEEDCVLARLKGAVAENGEVFLAYRATRDASGRKQYALFAGPSEALLEQIETRFYLRVLSLKYIGCNRDLRQFLRAERRHLLEDARGARDEEDEAKDATLLAEIGTALTTVSQHVKELTYVSKATDDLNAELRALAFQHESVEVSFSAGESDPSQFVEELGLVTTFEGRTLAVGGDGRNNQIQLALWASRNRSTAEAQQGPPLEVSLFCIEEPEAHLHPHQQRRLAEYLTQSLPAQVVMTTHSPQIACEFPPDSIIRLYPSDGTLAADEGSSELIGEAFLEFGHRLNVIPAEAFFSNVALLVEGRSEELFYKALSAALSDLNLDRLNISVVPVEGVGFLPYVHLFGSLSIPCVVRTDNDILRIPHKGGYRLAGIERAIQIYQAMVGNGSIAASSQLEGLIGASGPLLSGFPEKEPPAESRDAASLFVDALAGCGIYLASRDLETDLANSPLGDALQRYTDRRKVDEVVQRMQRHKATFMFSFLRACEEDMGPLRDDPLAIPLLRCKAIVETQHEHCAYL